MEAMRVEAIGFELASVHNTACGPGNETRLTAPCSQHSDERTSAVEGACAVYARPLRPLGLRCL